MAINGVNGYNSFPPKMDPDKYAQQYADRNGITLEEAKTELKAKYGDPQQKNGLMNADVSVFTESRNQTYDFSNYSNSDTSGGYGQGQNMFKGMFQNFLNMLRGGDGPRQEGDPQPHLNGSQGTSNGPQNEGDPQPHLDGSQNSGGPQKEGDPQPHLQAPQGANGPQNPGDPQPHLKKNPFGI